MCAAIDHFDRQCEHELEDVILQKESSVITADCVAERSRVVHGLILG
jgi:hypothetical protein